MIREGRFIGSAANLALSLDGILLYGLKTNEHVVLRVPPGQHVVGITFKAALNEDTARVDAVAQQRYYFRVETALFADSPKLQPVAASVGQALMAKTSLLRQ